LAENRPVVPRAEQVTFEQGVQAVVNNFKLKGRKSLDELERRIRLHLLPYFRGRRLASITNACAEAYAVHRQKQGIVRKGERISDVSNAEINRELQHLKRIFSLAVKQNRLGSTPHITMLPEHNVRTGFFEPAALSSVLRHLPTELQPVIQFAAITGWRVGSEVLPLEWRRIDFPAGEVRLDAGTTKNGKARVFPMNAALRQLLQEQHRKHEELKQAGQLVPWVFWRMKAERRGGPQQPQQIRSLTKAWNRACRVAGQPGRIPHDLRRTAVRNLVRAGVSRSTAMALVGHRTESVFERYNITSGDDLRDAARRLDAAGF
ncbi:MAG TPA: site-specific integrase, partial [Vicinamibacterales bacterium]|nr:site-specific integrase [Vicinamibacterales bacterium]